MRHLARILAVAAFALALAAGCGDDLGGDVTTEEAPPQTDATETAEATAGTTTTTSPAQPVAIAAPGGLYQVVGVAFDDVLNMRDAAGFDATALDALDPIETGIYETGNVDTAADGGLWWEVVHPRTGTVGWVNNSFLEPGAPMDGIDPPRPALDPADRCDPRRALNGSIDYTPLAALARVEVEADPVDPEVEAVLVGFEYLIEEDEPFQIVLAAKDATVIDQFIESDPPPQVCLDARRNADPPGKPVGPLELSDELLGAAEQFGVDLAELAADFEQAAQGLGEGDPGPSLAELVAAKGVPPEDVLLLAIDEAEAAAAGVLPASLADRDYLERLLTLLYLEPGAAVLRGPGEAELDADTVFSVGTELEGDDLSISMVFTGDPGRVTDISYAWDPTVWNWGTVQYKGRCAYDGRVQIRVTRGKAKVNLKRSSPWKSHHSYASAGQYSSNLFLSSRDRTTYRAKVYGRASGQNIYEIYGGWTEGSGGGC